MAITSLPSNSKQDVKALQMLTHINNDDLVHCEGYCDVVVFVARFFQGCVGAGELGGDMPMSGSVSMIRDEEG